MDYLSLVSIRAYICSQNSSWHIAGFHCLGICESRFPHKNYLFLFVCHLLQSYFRLSAGRGINTYRYSGTVACKWEGEWWRSFFLKRLTMCSALRMFSWKKSTLCYLRNLRVFVIISLLINNPCNYLLSLNGGLGKGWGFLKIHLILKCTLHHVMLIVLSCCSGFK